MQLVLDAPVTANHVGECLRVDDVAAPVVAALARGLRVDDRSLALDHDDAAQSFPFFEICKPVELLRSPYPAHFEPSVIAPIYCLVERVRHVLEVCRARVGEERF